MKINIRIKNQTITNHELELPAYYKRAFLSEWEYLRIENIGEEGKVIVENIIVLDNYVNVLRDVTMPDDNNIIKTSLYKIDELIPITQEEYQEAKNKLINTINEH